MVRASFQRRGAYLWGFRIEGHTGTAPRGQDLLCAAISALGQGTLIGLEEVAGIPVAVDLADGRLHCTLPQDLEPARREQAQVLLRTLLLSLRSLERDHGRHLKVSEEVVSSAYGQ